MYTQQTQGSMDTLKARLVSYGLKPSMRLTYNAVIVAAIPTTTDNIIELEYSHLGTGGYFINGKQYCTLKAALESVGLPCREQVVITSRDLQSGIVDLCNEGYTHNGNSITWYGYKGGVLDIETVDGSFSLELPCTLRL